MTKQEGIREELEVKINRFDTFGEEYSYRGFADEILTYLHSQGVVIKVDVDYGGMGKIQFGIHGDDERELIHSITINGIECIAVEPLIKDEDAKE